ncbi:phosphatidate cytidylyltransferase [Aggregatilineales bacterium SYSU G02658]
MTTRDTSQHQPQISNANQRILTGLVLIPLTWFVTCLGGWVMFGVLLTIISVGLLEFYHMEQQRYQSGNAVVGILCSAVILLSFQLQSVELMLAACLIGAAATFGLEVARGHTWQQGAFRILTTLGGVLYLAVPAGCLLIIRAIPEVGLWWVYVIYLATWGNDTMAYFIGRQFGRTPLAPKLSPNKTVEGAIGGVVGGIVFPMLFLLVVRLEAPSVIVVLLIAPFAGIYGDLFESALKRYFGLKDSGLEGLNLFPGHGGVLDRLDSLIAVTMVFFVYLLVIGQFMLS